MKTSSKNIRKNKKTKKNIKNIKKMRGGQVGILPKVFVIPKTANTYMYMYIHKSKELKQLRDNINHYVMTIDGNTDTFIFIQRDKTDKTINEYDKHPEYEEFADETNKLNYYSEKYFYAIVFDNLGVYKPDAYVLKTRANNAAENKSTFTSDNYIELPEQEDKQIICETGSIPYSFKILDYKKSMEECINNLVESTQELKNNLSHYVLTNAELENGDFIYYFIKRDNTDIPVSDYGQKMAKDEEEDEVIQERYNEEDIEREKKRYDGERSSNQYRNNATYSEQIEEKYQKEDDSINEKRMVDNKERNKNKITNLYYGTYSLGNIFESIPEQYKPDVFVLQKRADDGYKNTTCFKLTGESNTTSKKNSMLPEPITPEPVPVPEPVPEPVPVESVSITETTPQPVPVPEPITPQPAPVTTHTESNKKNTKPVITKKIKSGFLKRLKIWRTNKNNKNK